MEKPFEIERTFPVSAARLWRAITDPAEMKNWYFDLPGFKPEVGYEFNFLGGPPDGPQYKHLCRVTRAEPHKVLAYSWRYEGYEGNSEVVWELFPEGESTRLKLTHSGLETFPESNPDLAAKNFAEGWTEIIGKSLAVYLGAS
jgi:uncharacterized protein YndB with AHSA1/START domain